MHKTNPNLCEMHVFKAYELPLKTQSCNAAWRPNSSVNESFRFVIIGYKV